MTPIPSTRKISIGNVTVGGDSPLLVIAGPCVIESMEVLRVTAATLKEITQRLKVGLVFKSSFDKANRTRLSGYRGPGLEKGMEILDIIKNEFQIPVISDIHETCQVKTAAQVVDCLQIPAFLARQTDLLVAAAQSGLPVNVKKAQYMAPIDMEYALQKMVDQPDFKGLCLCERGSTYGYHNLVVDMRSLVILRGFGWPVIFDATHSLQLPSLSYGNTKSERQFVPALARAAVAVGIDGIFLETHPDPSKALCDSASQWPLDQMENLLKSLLAIREAGNQYPSPLV